MTRRRSRHLVVVPALATALALLVSGCGTREAGAAAVVGDRRISIAAVQAAYQDIVALVGQDQQVSQAQILNLLILEPYLTAAAANLGRGISTQDARTSLKSVPNGGDTDLGAAGLDVWRANLATTALSNNRETTDVQATYARIGAEVKADGVEINPRFGSGFDYTNFTILSKRPNWLVAPADEQPVPTPTP